MRAEKKFDIFELKSRIETHHSLNTLRSDIDKALREGIISREMFDTLKNKIEFIEHLPEKNILTKQSEKAFFDDEDLPFGKTEITKFLEKKKICGILVGFSMDSWCRVVRFSLFCSGKSFWILFFYHAIF